MLEEFRGNFTSLRRTFLFEFSHVLLWCFFRVGSLHRAPVCQPCGLRAEGIQPGSGTPSDSGSFLTWLTPWRWARCTARLISAVEQAGTSRLQVSASHDFCRKWEFENTQLCFLLSHGWERKWSVFGKWHAKKRAAKRQQDTCSWGGGHNRSCCHGACSYWLQTILMLRVSTEIPLNLRLKWKEQKQFAGKAFAPLCSYNH